MNWSKDFWASAVVAALVAGFVSIICAVLTAFVTLRTSARTIQVQNITAERAKWRDKIRAKAASLARAYATAATPNERKLIELRLEFALNLNPSDPEDQAILDTIDTAIKDLGSSKTDALCEFSERLTLLLKHDWERAKREAKPWIYSVFTRSPVRKRYVDIGTRPDPKWLQTFNESADRLAIFLACGLFLWSGHLGWLPVFNDWIKIAFLVGCIMFGCLWAVRFLGMLLTFWTSRVK